MVGPEGSKKEIEENIKHFGTDLGWFGDDFGTVWGHFRDDFDAILKIRKFRIEWLTFT